MEIKFNKRLPSFSFKEYVKSIIIDVDDHNEIINTISDYINSFTADIRPGYVLLFSITFYDGEWDIRIWIDPYDDEAVIVHNIEEENFNINYIYKIVIEVFLVSKEAAAIDIETISSYDVDTHKISLDQLTLNLSSILKASYPISGTRKPDISEPIQPESKVNINTPTSSDANYDIYYCIERLWNICSRYNCNKTGQDELSMLVDTGLLIMGKGNDYICIIREDDSSECKYRLFKISEKESLIKCLNDADDARVIIENTAQQGYEFVLA